MADFRKTFDPIAAILSMNSKLLALLQENRNSVGKVFLQMVTIDEDLIYHIDTIFKSLFFLHKQLLRSLCFLNQSDEAK